VLNKGENLMGWSGSVNMEEGEALAAQDCLPRLDGSVMKHYGYERVTPLPFAARPLALRSFNYKGKNNDEAGGNTARDGNLQPLLQWSYRSDGDPVPEVGAGYQDLGSCGSTGRCYCRH
jgi:hypothetical protein